MTDFLGQTLALGDTVVFCRPNYRELTYGVVLKFTPQKMRVLYKAHYGERTDTYCEHSSSFVKVDSGKLPEFLRTKYEELQAE